MGVFQEIRDGIEAAIRERLPTPDAGRVPVHFREPAQQPFDKDGVDVTGVSTPVVVGDPLRTKVELFNAGAARVFFGFAEPAVVDEGAFLDPSGSGTVYTDVDIFAISADGTAVRVTWQSWTEPA